MYVEGQSSESYIAMGFHNHQLKFCAKFGQENKCGEAGEIVVSAWLYWYHPSTIISSLPAACVSTHNWPNHQLTFMAGNVQLFPRNPGLLSLWSVRIQKGEWYSILLTLTGNKLNLQLNQNADSELIIPGTAFSVKGPLYIGGIPRHLLPLLTPLKDLKHCFHGYISSAKLGSHSVDFRNAVVMKEDGLSEGFNFAGPSEFLAHLIFRGFQGFTHDYIYASVLVICYTAEQFSSAHSCYLSSGC